MSSASTPPSGDLPESSHQNLPSGGSLESDFWSLDDEPVAPMPAALRGRIGDEMPPIRQPRAPMTMNSIGDSKSPTTAAGGKEIVNKPLVKISSDQGIRLNFSSQRESARPSGQPESRKSILGDFTDLEQWADDGGGHVKEGDALDALESAQAAVPPVEPETKQAVATQVEKVVESEAGPLLEESPKLPEETSVVPPKEVLPAGKGLYSGSPKFSPFERFSLVVLVVALVSVLGAVLYFSASRLPTETIGSRGTKFPVKGQRVTVQSATSYWRDVVESGPNADVVRRGTVLLPVFEMTCKGGPSVLRVIFRDEYGLSMGDTINRTVTDGGLLVIPATVGFEDVGMHAAYRTGDSKPWKIEVFEGAAGDESANGFTKLFEMDISSERR